MLRKRFVNCTQSLKVLPLDTFIEASSMKPLLSSIEQEFRKKIQNLCSFLTKPLFALQKLEKVSPFDQLLSKRFESFECCFKAAKPFLWV